MIGLGISIFLPLLVGAAWLHHIWKGAHWSAIVGYGYFIGLFLVTVIIRLLAWLGFELSFYSVIFVLLLIIALALAWAIVLRKDQSANFHLADCCKTGGSSEGWQRLVVLFLLAVLLVRFGTLFLEVIWRPLFPWDGWMNWAPKARVWFELNELVPFVDPVAWRVESSLNTVYTLGNWVAWDYPPTVPIIQLWSALGLGFWRDNYINAPWFFASAAIGFAFYGQARMLQVKPHVSLLFVYLLLSMPFMNVHTALAGYADLWMAAYYCLAGMALLNWASTRSTMQFVLFVVSSIACIQTKSPGIIWVGTMLLVLVLILIPARYRIRSIVAALGLVGAVLLLGGVAVDIPSFGMLRLNMDVVEIPGFMKFSLEYHAVWPYIIKNAFQYLSWNLYFYGIVFLFILLYLSRGWSSDMLLPLSVIVSGGAFIFIVFFFTHRYIEAVDSTTINRAMFHMVPMSVFSILYLYVLREEKIESN